MNTLRRLWNGWKKIARKIGDFQARVLLTVIYAVVVLPFGLAVRLFSDPLRTKRRPDAWLPRTEETDGMEFAKRQW